LRALTKATTLGSLATRRPGPATSPCWSVSCPISTSEQLMAGRPSSCKNYSHRPRRRSRGRQSNPPLTPP
jgi:hypothetical protein